MKRVCVIGLGYIGLPTASVLATSGYDVLGVDIDPQVVATVNNGGIHIEEPGLATVVRAAIQSGNLRAATEPEACDVYILAVPTPLTPDKKADMSYVRATAEVIVPCLKPGTLVILESTSPPGTCRDLLVPILEHSGLKVGADIHLAHCPERVLPGRILRELISNDRVVGGFDNASAEKARDLYATFVEGDILLTDLTTAELVKVLENTYRDVNIALANETALLCEELGVSFKEAAQLANRHPRVNVHTAGPGVGGHCISVDPWFLVDRFPEQTDLIRLARNRNDQMPEHVVATTLHLLEGIVSVHGTGNDSRQKDRWVPRVGPVGLTRARIAVSESGAAPSPIGTTRVSPEMPIRGTRRLFFKGHEHVQGIEAPKVAALGLAFKGNIDDMRESPALEIIRLLMEAGVDVLAHDPFVKKAPVPQAELEECLADADCLLLLTDHSVYHELEASVVGDLMRHTMLYDTRNMLDHQAWRDAGFSVSVLGVG